MMKLCALDVHAIHTDDGSTMTTTTTSTSESTSCASHASIVTFSDVITIHEIAPIDSDLLPTLLYTEQELADFEQKDTARRTRKARRLYQQELQQRRQKQQHIEHSRPRLYSIKHTPSLLNHKRAPQPLQKQPQQTLHTMSHPNVQAIQFLDGQSFWQPFHVIRLAPVLLCSSVEVEDLASPPRYITI
jgi:hypothetical protein